MAHKPTTKQTKAKKSKTCAKTYKAKTLGLDKRALPHSVVEVVSTLQRAGFEAYIVGGGVRDSLLGLMPKDFDAVTNARPHEIKAIFGGRCRIIGRRFQLAHVYSGREMIEVATFRAPPADDTHTTADGMLTRDNVWGTIEQDFARRDFSINALYYDPVKDEVLDFCGAIDDIKTKTLRLLGDAKVRIEEDPVRLLRALRFKAKLGFGFDKRLSKQFCQDNWSLLEQVSTHRLYDETQKMFCGGYLTPLLPLLFDFGAINSLMAQPPSTPSELLTQVAISSDQRVNQGKSTNPAFFYAALLWENYLHTLAKFKKKGLPFYEAQSKAASKVVQAQLAKTAIPRFAEEFITNIWLLQPKLVNPRVREIESLARHNRFRAAFDFLLMREQFDDCALSEATNGMGAWWQSYQMADAKGQNKLLHTLGKGKATNGRTHRQTSEELRQLQQLSMRQDQQELPPPKPLFVVEDRPTPKKRPVVVPIFDKVAYTDEDFLTLLNNDEPYIPSMRYRKRQPSSVWSIIEKEQGLDKLTNKTADKPPKKSATKKKLHKKPNAKPRADD